jgi:hypothetical protein
MDLTPYLAGPLVTNDELADYPGAPFSELAVEVASAMVRGACNWHIGPKVEGIEYTLDLMADTDTLVLNSLVVGAVTSVVDVRTGPIEGYRASGVGIIQLPRRIPRGIAAVTVTVDHGLDEIPADLKAVIADLARRHEASKSRPPDLRSRTVGAVTYTWVTGDNRYTSDPLSNHRHVLRRFTV